MTMQERPLTENMSTEEAISTLEGNTQVEIFDSVWEDKTEDDTVAETDTSPEEMEGILDDEIPEDQEEGDDEQEGEDESADPDEPDAQEAEALDQTPAGRGRTPVERLREVVEQRRQVEQERDTLRAQLAAFQAHLQMQQRPQPPQEQPAKPDIWSDPEAWAADQRAQIQRDWESRHVNSALAAAHEEHGEEFVAAYKALTSLNPGDPLARATVQRIWDAPNPGKSMMRWYGEQQAISAFQEAGGTEAYKQRVAREIMSDPEFRRQILADMRGEAQRGDGGRPRTQARLPRSLNGASGGGSVRVSDPDLYDNSDASAFAFATRP